MDAWMNLSITGVMRLVVCVWEEERVKSEGDGGI